MMCMNCQGQNDDTVECYTDLISEIDSTTSDETMEITFLVDVDSLLQ